MFKSFPEVVKMLEEDYDAVRYAVLHKKVVEPMQVGKARLFTADEILVLKKHLDNRGKIEFKGKRMTLQEWADSCGITIGTMRARLDSRGWTKERAFTQKKGRKKS